MSQVSLRPFCTSLYSDSEYRARPVIDRNRSIYEPIAGHIEFEEQANCMSLMLYTAAADLFASTGEKAYAIAQNCIYANQTGYLVLSMNADPTQDLPQPATQARLVKQLPDSITPGTVYDLFRRFGPLYRVRLQYDPDGRFG